MSLSSVHNPVQIRPKFDFSSTTLRFNSVNSYQTLFNSFGGKLIYFKPLLYIKVESLVLLTLGVRSLASGRQLTFTLLPTDLPGPILVVKIVAMVGPRSHCSCGFRPCMGGQTSPFLTRFRYFDTKWTRPQGMCINLFLEQL